MGDPDLASSIAAAVSALAGQDGPRVISHSDGDQVWVQAFRELVRAAQLRARARLRLLARPRHALGPGVS